MVYSYRIGTFGYNLNDIRIIISKNGTPMTFKLLENGWKQISNLHRKRILRRSPRKKPPKKSSVNSKVTKKSSKNKVEKRGRKKKIKKLKLPTKLVHEYINKIEKTKKKKYIPNLYVDLGYILPNVSYNRYYYTPPPSQQPSYPPPKLMKPISGEYSTPRSGNLSQSPTKLIYNFKN